MNPRLRAILIALHLCAIILKACPAPEGAMAKQDWAHPTVQAEFRQWTTVLNGAGLNITQQELEEELWYLATQITTIRNATLFPFRQYYRYVGSDQNWRLFVAPHMFPSQLEIDVEINENWTPIYRVFDGPKWMAHLIENGRFRPSIFRYSWGRYNGQYNRFAQFLSTQAEQDFPDATAIRIRWWRYPLPSHTDILQQFEIQGKYHSPLLYRLDQPNKGRTND